MSEDQRLYEKWQQRLEAFDKQYLSRLSDPQARYAHMLIAFFDAELVAVDARLAVAVEVLSTIKDVGMPMCAACDQTLEIATDAFAKIGETK